MRVAWPWVALIITFAGSTYMVRDDLYHGETNYLLLFLLTLGLWLHSQGRTTASGVNWGLIFIVKPFVGLLVPYLLWRRQWRTALAAICTSGTLMVLSFVPTLPTGLATVRGWVQVSGYYSSAAYSSRPDNIALHGFILRLFSANDFTAPWLNSGLLVTTLSFGALIVLLLAFFAAVPGKKLLTAPDSERAALLLAEVGLVVALGMAYGPLTEGDHLQLLLPGLVGVLLIARRRVLDGSPLRWRWVATALALGRHCGGLGAAVSVARRTSTSHAWCVR